MRACSRFYFFIAIELRFFKLSFSFSKKKKRYITIVHSLGQVPIHSFIHLFIHSLEESSLPRGTHRLEYTAMQCNAMGEKSPTSSI